MKHLSLSPFLFNYIYLCFSRGYTTLVFFLMVFGDVICAVSLGIFVSYASTLNIIRLLYVDIDCTLLVASWNFDFEVETIWLHFSSVYRLFRLLLWFKFTEFLPLLVSYWLSIIFCPWDGLRFTIVSSLVSVFQCQLQL